MTPVFASHGPLLSSAVWTGALCLLSSAVETMLSAAIRFKPDIYNGIIEKVCQC